jgi:intein/homing endonuclease
MVTPHLTLKDIPMVVINHTYKTMELYAKDVVGGGCVVEDTMIQTPEGVKPVQDFVVGDIVKTLQGDKEVTSVWNPDTLDEGEPECFEIEFEDGFKVVCSDKHKFLIGDVWVEAKDLIVGMESVVY